MDFFRTNWIAVIASTVAGMALGFVWYGMLFLSTWAAGNGFTFDETHTKAFKNGVEVVPNMGMQMGGNALGMVVFALLMNWLLRRQGVSTWQGGATTGAVVGLIGMVGVFVGNLYSMAPTSLSVCDGCYTLVLFTIIGAIMGGMKRPD